MKKPPKCPECNQPYERRVIGQKTCAQPSCAISYARRNPKVADKVNRAVNGLQRRARAKQKRDKLKSMETVTDCLNAAQRQVNRYVVHVRDRDQPCISCGTYSANKWDCGHFRTRKAASHLRFNMDNVFKQCSRPCNLDLSGNILNMERGMIARIGKERVEAIKNDNRIHKWTKEEAREVEAIYKAKLKELQA